MLNLNGVLTVLDRGLTVNWDDGPTLHKITAQVRYHTTESATSQLLRINAAQCVSDDPMVFVAADTLARATWCWRERGPGWTAELSIVNTSPNDLFVDALDVIRIDASFGGVFNLGAPPGLWRCARESAAAGGDTAWEAWAESTTSAGGFTRFGELLIRPAASNRSRPPCILVQANPATAAAPTDLKLECTGERFERFTARTRADGTLLGGQAALASAEFRLASGDDPDELRRWANAD